MVAPKSVEEMRDQNLFLNNGEASLGYLPIYAHAMQWQCNSQGSCGAYKVWSDVQALIALSSSLLLAAAHAVAIINPEPDSQNRRIRFVIFQAWKIT